MYDLFLILHQNHVLFEWSLQLPLEVAIFASFADHLNIGCNYFITVAFYMFIFQNVVKNLQGKNHAKLYNAVIRKCQC